MHTKLHPGLERRIFLYPPTLVRISITSFPAQENVNMKKKTLYDLKLFKEFLTSEGGREDFRKFLPPAKLQQFAIKFVLGEE